MHVIYIFVVVDLILLNNEKYMINDENVYKEKKDIFLHNALKKKEKKRIKPMLKRINFYCNSERLN